jgi:TPR repeat protein
MACAVLIIFGSLPCAAQLQNDTISRGIAAFNSQNFNKAFRYLIKPARMGDAAAQLFLGRMYLEGGGAIRIEKDKGYAYIKKSANKGNINALWYLTQNHKSGNYIGKNINASIEYANKLCERRVLKACTFEANLLQLQPNINSRGKACTKFAKLYRIEGEISAAVRLAECIIKGKIESKTSREIEKLLKVAIDNKNSEAPKMLLHLYLDSKDDKKIVQGAKLAYQLITQRQFEQNTIDAATSYLNFAFQDTHCVAVEKFDIYPLIEQVCKKAVSNGGNNANLVLAKLYYSKKSGAIRDLRIAEKYALAAANHDIKGASKTLIKIWKSSGVYNGKKVPLKNISNIKTGNICEILNSTLFDGINANGVRRKTVTKIYNYCKLVLSSQAILQFSIVYRDEFGDFNQYINLLRLACDKDDPDACTQLGIGHSSDVESLKAYKKAAMLGQAEGAYQCYSLANELANDIIIDEDEESGGKEQYEKTSQDCFNKALLLNHPQVTVVWAEKKLGWFPGTADKRAVCTKIKRLMSKRILEAPLLQKAEKYIQESCY